MGIRPEEVRRVAELARLELGEGETERMAAELSAVLDYAEAIRRLAPPPGATPEPGGAADLRADEPGGATLTNRQALAMAPASQEGFFVVPAFLESAEP